MMMSVYISKGCSYCEKVIEHLEKNGAPFETKNVSEDPANFREWKDLNVMGTPTVYFEGDMVVGYDPKKLDELIHKVRG
ncbi:MULTISPECIES: glutaredoxin family protein [Bacillaceae]|uniref:Glutaredoxin family protein n=1 Tax=Evansella alkalicola TaxID=745819 RepID=A0ABS6JS37_9BACI|nr:MULTISPECIES: glutaredoxin family protein [Bacillaceae]MBU9720524.1 glutaredoxin family protein [Bacillus alkalicola]